MFFKIIERQRSASVISAIQLDVTTTTTTVSFFFFYDSVSA